MQLYRYDVVDNEFEQQYNWPVDPDNEWARPDTITTHDIKGIVRTPNGELISELNLKEGDKAYLVYVLYSTGNSFGRDYSKYLSPIHLFDSVEKAAECIKDILEHYSQNDENGPNSINYNCPFTGNDGRAVSVCASWIGYFEEIVDVDYKEVEVVNFAVARRFM